MRDCGNPSRRGEECRCGRFRSGKGRGLSEPATASRGEQPLALEPHSVTSSSVLLVRPPTPAGNKLKLKPAHDWFSPRPPGGRNSGAEAEPEQRVGHSGRIERAQKPAPTEPGDGARGVERSGTRRGRTVSPLSPATECFSEHISATQQSHCLNSASNTRIWQTMLFPNGEVTPFSQLKIR